MPYDTIEVTVVNGTTLDFRFYEGYKKKYPSVSREWRDVFRKERRKSARRLRREKE